MAIASRFSVASGALLSAVGPKRVLVVGLVATLLLTACSRSEPETMRGAVRDPAPDVSGLALQNATASNAPFNIRAEPNQLLLVFFGFASCPDICPTTMAELRMARQDLGEEGARVRPAMVTVDPARDTDRALADYVHRFADDGVALRTDDQNQLQQVTKAFAASYEVRQVEGAQPEVGHSAYLYAVDDTGRIRVQWSFGTPRQDITHDLDLLLQQVDKEKKAV